MPARALFVLLVMLNVGVATWWLLRPGPSAPAPWAPPADVPRLQLLGEQVAVQAVPGHGGGAMEDAAQPEAVATPEDIAPRAGTQAAAPVAPEPPVVADTTATAAATQRCASFGPFADAGSVAAARSALQPLGATHMRVRDVVDAPRGWRVVMAPQADRATADALAAKIRAAGFDDLLVVPSGDEANGIALGRYGSEPSARRRESSLREAGFAAQAQPLGGGVRYWLDVAAGPAFDAAAGRVATAAAQVEDLACADIVAAGASR